MRFDFEVELPDAPGELSRLLQVVATHGGNVLSVLHRHERAVQGRVPVAITAEVPEAQALRLLDALARTHRILRVDREGGPARAAVVLVGHVFEADLRRLMDRVFANGASVGAVDARIAGRAEPSAVLLSLTADGADALRAAIGGLREDARAAQLTMIEQVAGEPGE